MENLEFQFKKKYGQNFIKENSIVKNIVKVADIKDNTLLIEIGPGSGALTKELAKTGNNVLCYEIDSSLEEILAKNLLDYPNVKILFDDFLKRDLEEDIASYSYEQIYVVANLPYYITTPIIMKLIESKVLIDKIVIMVQKEVGDRLCAKANTKDYGSLTVFLNYYFTVKKEFIVSKNAFVPKPNVDSVVISLTRKREEDMPKVEDLDYFFNLIKCAFHFKRKNLKNNFKELDLSLLEEGLKNLSKDLTYRAEQLTLEDFAYLSNWVTAHKK